MTTTRLIPPGPSSAASPRTRPTHDEASNHSSASTDRGCATASHPKRPPHHRARRHATGDGGGVAERADPRTRQPRRPQAGRRRRQEQPPTATAPSGRSERRPQRLAVTLAQLAAGRVHAAGRERRSVGDAGAATGGAHRAGQRDVVEDGTRDRLPPAGPGQRVGLDHQELAVGHRHRRSRGALGEPQRKRGQPGPGQQRLDESARTAHAVIWRGHGQSRSSGSGPRSIETAAATASGARTTSASTKTRISPRAAAASCAQACGLPKEPRGGELPVNTRQSRIGPGRAADDVGGAVGGAVVEHQDVDVAQPALGEQANGWSVRSGAPRPEPAPAATPRRSPEADRWAGAAVASG